MFEQLIWRGAKNIIVKADLEQKLKAGKPLRVKYGIDPTGAKIHLGHASVIRKLKHFQALGHQIVLIIGDFTARIGDPSDKESERPALAAEEIKNNVHDYEKQLARIFDLSKVEIRYNSEWFNKLPLGEFLKLSQLFSVAQMLERENFKQRFKNSRTIRLHEFLYPLLQGYDSMAVRADLEIGGTDQLFNLLAGRTVQKYFGQSEQNIITYELLVGADGRKMSKSWSNAIWVTDDPANMYGRIMALPDELILGYFALVTDLPDDELTSISAELKNKANPRDLKARLAREIATLYHGPASAEDAAVAFERQFREKRLPENIDEIELTKSEWGIEELLVFLNLAKTKSEARRLFQQGAVRLDQEKVTDNLLALRNGSVVQVGKLKFKRIKLV